MNGVITMRNKDLERIKVMHQLAMKQITQLEAGKLMRITDRQVGKLFKRYKDTGNKGVISKKLGRSSNRQLPQATKNEALKLIAEKYTDFGPTLAAEKLRKVHVALYSDRHSVFQVEEKALYPEKNTLHSLNAL